MVALSQTQTFWGNVNVESTLTANQCGIGTVSPVNDLDVGANALGTLTGARATISSSSANSGWDAGQGTSNRGHLTWIYNSTAANAYMTIGTHSGSNYLELQDEGGNVGIGTATPGYLLDVNGTLHAQGNVTFSGSSNSVGTISSGTWNGAAVGTSYGGTGATSALAGFNALSPMTSKGDLTYENATPTAVRLAIGSAGDVLTVASGIPSWAAIDLTGSATALSGSLGVANGGTGASSLTQYDVVVGNGTSAVSLIAPSSTSGVPLISQGSSSNPAYGTAVVAGGGTGSTSFTAYAPVCAASTTTGALTSCASGLSSSGYVLTSNGSSSAPTWQAPGTPSFSGLTSNAVSYASNSSTITTVSSAGTSGQVLMSNGSSSAPSMQTLPGSSTILKAPTIQTFTSTGTQTGWLFTISTSTTCAVGDTYTNNGNTYTVEYALSAQSGQVLWMSGTGATSGTTLSRSSGSGTSSIAFSAKIATATYTLPTNPSPLYLHVKLVGSGGAGGCSGSGSFNASGAGSITAFSSTIYGNGGGAGSQNSPIAAGGSASASGTGVTSVITYTGAYGNGAAYSNSSSFDTSGGVGASSAWGGGGGGGYETAGGAATAPGSGGGGAGGGATSGFAAGWGGAAGGYAEALISGSGLASSIYYVVGTGGGAGSAGTSGYAGGNGAAGIIVVEEHYQ